ncbi:potassium channel family protein [Clostridium estertheticum]|uniref:potassium channel family protein n=1 Tax=Clostridium estertheticum TaxID=238834 RepID=UPI001CF1FD2F|nr:potassium channel family protein [Clostridium estertheticum]MCB2354369.1 potassium channel family protein [Clostridium estertheticum]WAG42512.1 potassium channel family protein [Clostridium estertheticum]
MEINKLLNYQPAMMFIILVIMFITFTYTRKQFRIYRKVLIKYFLISFVIIFLFELIYLAVFIDDLKKINIDHSGEIKKNKVTIEEKMGILNKYSHIRGLNFIDYKDNVSLPFIDLAYFSSMTFFTVGYGDITLIGILRFFPILESFLGVATTGIYISMALSNSTKTDKEEERLNMMISKGNDILCVSKTKISNYYTFFSTKPIEKYDIYLVDSNNNINVIYNIEFDHEKIEFYHYFIIKWDFKNYKNNDSDYYWKFAKYLSIKLEYDIDYSIELNKFSKNNVKINIEEFKCFLNKLYINQKYRITGKTEYSDRIRINESILKAMNKI